MKRALRDRWIKALRSGRYKQTTGQLGAVDTQTGKPCYCCLGVLAKVAACEKIIDTPKLSDGEMYLPEGDSARNDELPAHIRREVGLTPKQHKRLIELNDDRGYSFREIADYIEAKIKAED